MRKLKVIGIGAGSPAHVTLEAIDALQQCSVVFALDKGATKHDLLDARRVIINTHAPHVRLVIVPDPPRDRNPQEYGTEVRDWHEARAVLLKQAIETELCDDSSSTNATGAFLVWGDPSLYDSTLRIIERMRNHGLEVDIDVIPGITAIQALTAAHAATLNRIGKPVLVTTGRRLAEAPENTDRVVMLDGGAAWLEHARPEEEILWGAYLGTEKEVLRRGRIGDIGTEIAELKQQLRAEHGWIMDIYLLRSVD